MPPWPFVCLCGCMLLRIISALHYALHVQYSHLVTTRFRPHLLIAVWPVLIRIVLAISIPLPFWLSVRSFMDLLSLIGIVKPCALYHLMFSYTLWTWAKQSIALK